MERRHVRDIQEISEKKEEIQRVCKAWDVFASSYEDLIQRAIVREDYVAGRRRGIIGALMARVSKTVIAQEIRESLESGNKREKKNIRLMEELEGDWKSAGERRSQSSSCRKQKQEGGRRVSVKRDGQMRMLPQEVVDELTWRREQKRRQLLARWEAPPPGPPKVENE